MPVIGALVPIRISSGPGGGVGAGVGAGVGVGVGVGVGLAQPPKIKAPASTITNGIKRNFFMVTYSSP